MDYGQVIHRTFDDSYVTTKDSIPYHVPNEGEFVGEWTEVRTYAGTYPECMVVEQPYVPPVLTLEELKAAKKAWIDVGTSAVILAGFDYAVDDVIYHFSYDAFDQQNFTDTVNVCIMKQSGAQDLPDSVTWNACTVSGGELERLIFDASGSLAPYAGGAMRRKNGTMQHGGECKAVVEVVTAAGEVEAAWSTENISLSALTSSSTPCSWTGLAKP